MLVKACSPRRFWLTSFVAANVLIDLEVLYYLHRGELPLHRFLHSYLGGSGMGLVGGLLMFAAALLVARVAPSDWKRLRRLRETSRRQLLGESIAAGLAGGVSHVFLDSLMHRDMHPFWPLAEGNALAGIVSVGTLHIVLALTGFFGVVYWLLLRDAEERP